MAALGTTTLGPRHGELVLAFSPERLAARRPGDPFEVASTLLEGIAWQGARLPSERRVAARAESEASGIARSETDLALLERLESEVSGKVH